MCTSNKKNKENPCNSFEDFLYIGIIILNSLLILSILKKWIKALLRNEE